MIKKNIILILVIFLFFTLTSEGISRTKLPRIITYEIDVEFYPDHETDYAGFIEILEGNRPPWNKEDSIRNYPHMKGRVLMEIDIANPVEKGKLSFYIHGELRAHKVTLDSKEVKFSEERIFYRGDYSKVGDKITINIGKLTGSHKIGITYGGLFSPSCAGSPSNYMTIDRNGAYLRGFGYSPWFPTILKSGDDTYPVNFKRVNIKTTGKFSAVFTGTRIGEITESGFRISSWEAIGIDPWHAQITVRPFKVKSQKGVHLYFLDNKKSESVSGDILKFVGKLLDHFEDNYKPIKSSPQVHIAEMPNFASGISSGNMIGMTSGQWRRFSLDDKDINMELLVSHELVHKFVQPEISIKSPLAALFIEGFPSYFHLNTLSDLIGEKWYQDYMKLVEKYYLKRKKTGMNYRGKKLPVEKPILSITFDEIGEYKDTFILNDRVRLFLNYLRERAGKVRFKEFTRELCSSKNLSVQALKKMIIEYYPGLEKELELWLESNEYPDHLKLNR